MIPMRVFATSVATMAICFATSRGYAQSVDSAEAASTASVGEIVVTAQKRAQKLSEIGITVAAPSGAALQTAGVTSVADLGKVVPGFSSTISYTGFPIFSIRGLSFRSIGLATPPAVSVYVDEAPLPFSAMTQPILLDVERVELLKGPQGTLFGQNSTGGSINVIAAKPTDHLAAGGRVEVDNFGQMIAEGYVSGPVTGNLNARLAATTTQFGGWQRGYIANHMKSGRQDRGAARLLLDWRPTDRLTIATNLTGSFNRSERLQQFQAYAIDLKNPAAPNYYAGYFVPPTSARDLDNTPGQDRDSNDYGYFGSIRVDYELFDAATLTSLTSYARNKLSNYADLDGTALQDHYGRYGGRIRSFSQELRVAGKLVDGRLNYLFGVNYEDDRVHERNHETFDLYSGLPANTQLFADNLNTTKSFGIFGNTDFEIAPRLTLSAGARYTKVKEGYAGCMRGNDVTAGAFSFISFLLRGAPPPDGAFVGRQCVTINDDPTSAGFGLPTFTNSSQKEHNVSWRGRLDYKIVPNVLVYGSVSRGFKAGIIPNLDTVLTSELNPVSQEKVTAYEAGTKIRVNSIRTSVNIAGFIYDYRNKQIFTQFPSAIGPLSLLVNVPKAKVRGIDFDVTSNPVEGLSLRGAFTYIDTRIGRFTDYTFANSPSPVDVTGNKFSYAPPWSASFDAEYKFPLSERLTGYLGGSGLYNSKTYGDLANSPLAKIIPYFLLDARLGIESSKGWTAGLFVRNLTNKYYWESSLLAGDTLVHLSGAPRTYGFSLSVKY